MQIAPINCEAEYEAALRRVEILWDAESGTPEEVELDALFALVEAYEDEHYPIDLPSSGSIE